MLFQRILTLVEKFENIDHYYNTCISRTVGNLVIYDIFKLVIFYESISPKRCAIMIHAIR